MRNEIKNALLRAFRLAALCVLSTLFLTSSLSAEEAGWPRKITTSQGTVTVYLPQVESFEDDILSGRAAISVQLAGEEEPVFGTIWIVAGVDIDREERLAYAKNIRIPRVHFSNSTPAKEAQLAGIIEEAAKKGDLTLSIDRIIPMLEIAEKEQHTSQNLSNDPPVIIYKETPSVLVSIDGQPKLTEVENSKLKQIINTSFFILFDESQPLYYLYASENGWYTTKDIKGDWLYTTSVPEDVKKLAPKADEIDAPVDSDEIEGAVPLIIAATEPTELLFTEGKPVFSDLPGTAISYVSNTENVIIRHGKHYYILLSGRWFTSKSLEGGWKYTAADKLPEDFAKIPADSDIGGALYAIAGTDEANEAVLDSYIPQTAKVDRKNVTIKVQYDGEPKFEDIPGTNLKYAVNSDQQVLLSGKHYYACADAVWYVADKPNGPWSVATERPEGVDQIPPESPVYNVKYVYIYDVQPDVVYVGYLPGYTGTYIYHSTIVYGTGYYYHPWYHHYYYPRRGTWSVGVRYSPWGGWSFGIGYSTGRFTFGIGFGGHRYGYRGGYHRGYHRGYNRGYSHGARAGYRAGSRNAHRSSNVYRNQNRSGIHSPERRANQGVKNTARQNTKNNMYSDRKGDVYKRQSNGNWQQQSNKSNASASQKKANQQKPSQKPNTTASQNRAKQQQRDSLNRQQHARDRGNQRTQQHRSSQRSHASRSGGNRGGGGSRGGGGRR
jgi:hypothetical protein